MEQIDYNRYFESMGNPGGKAMLQYYDFSLKACKAAQVGWAGRLTAQGLLSQD